MTMGSCGKEITWISALRRWFSLAVKLRSKTGSTTIPQVMYLALARHAEKTHLVVEFNPAIAVAVFLR